MGQAMGTVECSMGYPRGIPLATRGTYGTDNGYCRVLDEDPRGIPLATRGTYGTDNGYCRVLHGVPSGYTASYQRYLWDRQWVL